MSYVSWHIYGYGICVSNITEKSVERLKKLLAMAPEVQKEVSEWLGDCGITEPTYEDYMDFDQDFGLGLASILWKVIYIAEGIDLVECENNRLVHNKVPYLVLWIMYKSLILRYILQGTVFS